jgi:hypothetical protein
MVWRMEKRMGSSGQVVGAARQQEVIWIERGDRGQGVG